MTAKKIIPIKYTSRDFASIKAELVEYAKKYYPDTFKDFSEAGFGALMLDSVAYVGDILSFYTDYNANEGHIKTSIEFDNILKHGYKLGFKYSPFPSSSGFVSIYCLVPANASGFGPNLSYAPIIKRGTTFSAGSNLFTLTNNVNMANTDFSVRVATTDPDTGVPTYYAIKGFGTVISGINKTQITTVGDFKRFRKIEINDINVAEIVSIVDAEGNEYFEVDYLSQNISYKEIPNTSSDFSQVSNILVPFATPRRFILEREKNRAIVVFGASDSVEVENDQMLEDPNRFVMQMHGKRHITDMSFDPNKLINSDKFGIGPSNTRLTITYRVNTTENVNASASSINNVSKLVAEFQKESTLNVADVEDVKSSIIVENEDPINGYVRTPDAAELKIRILDNFATQNRAVTEKDYEALCYSMPSKFGAIKRIKATKDQDSFKRNLNLYVISEDKNGYLTEATISLKNNLKTWIEKNKVVSDTIDILDAKIVNLSIDFVAVGLPGKSKYEVQENALTALREYFSRTPSIGEPFMINDVLSVLKRVSTVLDVKEVTVKTKRGSNYARTPININSSTNNSAYDNTINVPLNVIWEIKYPDADIRGTII